MLATWVKTLYSGKNVNLNVKIIYYSDIIIISSGVSRFDISL